MPVEPLSTTASVISVTCLAYQSCKALRNIINGLTNAPDTLKGLYITLETFETVTDKLQLDLNGLEDSVFSPDQKDSLKALEPVMQHCNKVCGAFVMKLAELTSHSKQDHVAWIDRFRLHFKDHDIRMLKEDLAQCQRTLNDALSFTNMRTANRTEVALDELTANYAQSVSDIGGKIQGLELSIQTFSASSASSAAAARRDVDEVLKVLKDHNQMLKLCLQVYEPALNETSRETGTTVKYERAFDSARVATGNIDFHGKAPPIQVESAVAWQQARIHNGNMTTEASKVFWDQTQDKQEEGLTLVHSG